jgi:hypothetical protein
MGSQIGCPFLLLSGWGQKHRLIETPEKLDTEANQHSHFSPQLCAYQKPFDKHSWQ